MVACFALHNFCVKHEVPLPAVDDENEEVHLPERGAAGDLESVAAKRNRLALQHFSKTFYKLNGSVRTMLKLNQQHNNTDSYFLANN